MLDTAIVGSIAGVVGAALGAAAQYWRSHGGNGNGKTKTPLPVHRICPEHEAFRERLRLGEGWFGEIREKVDEASRSLARIEGKLDRR
jgi:hypothetical protein